MDSQSNKSERAIYESAIRLLGHREHSTDELRRKLQQRFLTHRDLIEATLTRLATDGYVSDQRFAQAYARSRSAKGFGSQRIALELQQRGIDQTLIHAVLCSDAFDTQAGEVNEALLKTWRKKFSHPPADLSEKAKQTRFLRYRGFTQRDLDLLFAWLLEQRSLSD